MASEIYGNLIVCLPVWLGWSLPFVRKKSNLHITVPLWGESTIDWWIPFIKKGKSNSILWHCNYFLHSNFVCGDLKKGVMRGTDSNPRLMNIYITHGIISWWEVYMADYTIDRWGNYMVSCAAKSAGVTEVHVPDMTLGVRTQVGSMDTYYLSPLPLMFKVPCGLLGSGQSNWIISSHQQKHDDVMTWKHFPHYWPFVKGIHQVTGGFPSQRTSNVHLMFPQTNRSINTWLALDLRHHDAYVTSLWWYLKTLLD